MTLAEEAQLKRNRLASAVVEERRHQQCYE